MLAVAGCAHKNKKPNPSVDDAGYEYRFLGPGDRELFAALAVPMLGAALPAEASARATAIEQVVRGVDIAADGLQPGVQSQLQQLFGLLEFPLSRSVLGGVWDGWSDASPEAVSAFLDRWRFSGISLFRSGYQALHQLVMSAWYGQNAAWARIGYPGPPIVN